MKKNFYVHGTEELVDLDKDSDILRKDWSKRWEVKYQESIIYHEIYNREDYIQGDCKIEPGDIVVDCGGNVGIFTSFALDMGASRILSYEPFIYNYNLNKKNNPNAEIFNLAVSNNSNETVELLYTESGNGGHTIVNSEMDIIPEHIAHKNLYVNTITLDDIISQNYLDHIDFLKIDTEGSELMILDGLSIENLQKIRCIAMEYHHNVFNYDDEVYNNLIKKFNSLGFNTFTWFLDMHSRMIYISRGDVFTENPKNL